MHQVSEQGREREREMGDEREEEETREGGQSRLTDGRTGKHGILFLMRAWKRERKVDGWKRKRVATTWEYI